MKANKSTGWDRVDQTSIVPEGKHVAILYSIVDLGTQEINSKEYGVSFKRQVQLTWELPKVQHEFKQWEWLRPATVKRKCTLSMHEKAQLRSIINNLLGRQLPDSEAEDYDLSELLGTMCQLQIGHDKTDKGNYLSIINFINLTDDEKEFYTNKWCVAFNDVVLFDLDNYDQRLFDSLPQFIKDTIIKSPEYNNREQKERTGDELIEELETETKSNDPEKVPVNDDLPY